MKKTILPVLIVSLALGGLYVATLHRNYTVAGFMHAAAIMLLGCWKGVTR